MRFSNVISTLLVAASLGGSVAAFPSDANKLASVSTKQLLARDDPLDIDGDDDAWEAAGKMCADGAGASKRLSKRAPPSPSTPVPMGGAEAYDSIPLAIDTKGLVTCIGVVVIGKKSDGTKFRALGHMAASKAQIADSWKLFSGKVPASDLKDMKSYMRVPDLDDDKPDGWNDDIEDLEKNMIKEVKKLLKDLTGDDPEKVHEGPMTDKGGDSRTMWVTADNEVYADGKHLSGLL